eukprot:Polyplicarium_translucidae@DN2155_c0_g1_i1.p1
MEPESNDATEFMTSDNEEEAKATELLGLRLAEDREAQDGKPAEADPAVQEMAERLEVIDDELSKYAAEMEAAANTAEGGDEENLEVDRRSIYVGNVDYGSTPQELQEHFGSCGQINRITIMVDKYTGHPKGFAYVEFSDPESVANAVLLSDSVFRGRQIKVVAKRKNVPGFGRGRGRGRGRIGRGAAAIGAPWARRGRGAPFARGYGPRYRGRFRPPRGPY